MYYGLGNTIVTDQANFIVLVVLYYENKNKDVVLTFSIFSHFHSGDRGDRI